MTDNPCGECQEPCICKEKNKAILKEIEKGNKKQYKEVKNEKQKAGKFYPLDRKVH